MKTPFSYTGSQLGPALHEVPDESHLPGRETLLIARPVALAKIQKEYHTRKNKSQALI